MPTTPDFPFETPIPYRDTLDGFLGIEFDLMSDDEVRARVPIHTGLLQEMGLLHGGTYAAVAESLASVPTLLAAHRDGKTAVGLSNFANFLRPVRTGTLHAHARRVAQLNRAWLWDVEFVDDEQELCSIVRVTVAITTQR